MMAELGRFEEVEGGWRLRFERRLPHSPEKVWRALTEEAHLAAWFPTTIEGELTAGARLRFSFREGEGESFDGVMLGYDAPRLMEFRWGEDVIRLEVRPDCGGSVLTLLDTLTERGRGARDGAGWHVSLDALERHMVSSSESGEPWQAVHARYVVRLGPEASTIGPPGGGDEAA
jgi:uncharacterized protein YndB with AHSA1/START domain